MLRNFQQRFDQLREDWDFAAVFPVVVFSLRTAEVNPHPLEVYVGPT
ncbi:hypothetical protein OAS39_00070 [Pirellulales bacterium]|nr:hypothetical protein [Pirellulales bacterium]